MTGVWNVLVNDEHEIFLILDCFSFQLCVYFCMYLFMYLFIIYFLIFIHSSIHLLTFKFICIPLFM